MGGKGRGFVRENRARPVGGVRTHTAYMHAHAHILSREHNISKPVMTDKIFSNGNMFNSCKKIEKGRWGGRHSTGNDK